MMLWGCCMVFMALTPALCASATSAGAHPHPQHAEPPPLPAPPAATVCAGCVRHRCAQGAGLPCVPGGQQPEGPVPAGPLPPARRRAAHAAHGARHPPHHQRLVGHRPAHQLHGGLDDGAGLVPAHRLPEHRAILLRGGCLPDSLCLSTCLPAGMPPHAGMPRSDQQLACIHALCLPAPPPFPLPFCPSVTATCPCPHRHPAPPLRPAAPQIYFLCLLLHRDRRDDHACRLKYGKDWDKFCAIVKYRMFPLVY